MRIFPFSKSCDFSISILLIATPPKFIFMRFKDSGKNPEELGFTSRRYFCLLIPLRMCNKCCLLLQISVFPSQHKFDPPFKHHAEFISIRMRSIQPPIQTPNTILKTCGCTFTFKNPKPAYHKLPFILMQSPPVYSFRP